MNSEISFMAPSWKEIYNLLLRQVEKIHKSGFKPDIIVGVSRGGWVPARILSDLLENSNLATVGTRFYSQVAESRGEPVITQPVSMAVTKKSILVVDEIIDTGRTLILVKDYIKKQGAKEVRLAVLYYKPWSLTKPDYYEERTLQWIVFPWDLKETARVLFRKCSDKGSSREEEAAKLVKAGAPAYLIERFLKEIIGEENC